MVFAFSFQHSPVAIWATSAFPPAHIPTPHTRLNKTRDPWANTWFQHLHMGNIVECWQYAFASWWPKHQVWGLRVYFRSALWHTRALPNPCYLGPSSHMSTPRSFVVPCEHSLQGKSAKLAGIFSVALRPLQSTQWWISAADGYRLTKGLP